MKKDAPIIEIEPASPKSKTKIVYSKLNQDIYLKKSKTQRNVQDDERDEVLFKSKSIYDNWKLDVFDHKNIVSTQIKNIPTRKMAPIMKLHKLHNLSSKKPDE